MERTIKIDLSSFEPLIVAEDPWSEQTQYCNLALYQFLGITPNKNLKYPPRNFIVKSCTTNVVYPELKLTLTDAHSPKKKGKFFVLASFNSKTKDVYLEGFAHYDDLVQEKNLHKSRHYILSYYDLRDMSELKDANTYVKV